MFDGPSNTTIDGSVDTEIDDLFVGILDQFVGVPPVVLNTQLGDLELRRRALDAETAAAIHVAEMSGSFSVDGHRSMIGYLKARLNWSGGQAARWLKISRFHPHMCW